MTMEMTIAEQRAIYMSAFKQAVEAENIENAKNAFLENILPANNSDWGNAIADVAQSYVGCSFQTAVTAKTMLGMLEPAHPKVVEAIEAAAKSCDVELRP